MSEDELLRLLVGLDGDYCTHLVPRDGSEVCAHCAVIVDQMDAMWERTHVTRYEQQSLEFPRHPRLYAETMRRLRQRVLGRDGTRCHYCQRDGDDLRGPDGNPWTVDHKHPVALGGGHEMSNLVPACRDCNSRKGATPYDEFIGVMA